MTDTTTLGDVANIIGGYAFKSADLGTSGVPVVKIAEISPPRIDIESCERIPPEKVQGLDRFRLREGDILMAMTGATTGKAGRLRTREHAYLNQRVAKLTAKDGQEFDDYVWALVSQPGFDQLVLANAHGSAQPNVSTEGIGRISVPQLSKQDRLRVGQLVRALDDKMEQNLRTGVALEALAQATFKAWFMDFEPVKAKAAGQTGFPAMPAAVFAILPDRLTHSPLGPVPQGWEIRSIGDLVTVKGGGTPSTKVAEYWDGGSHFWATPKDLSGLQEPVLLETNRRITDAGAECISSGVLPENTVLLSSRAPVGYTALAKVPVAVNQGFIAMACDGPLPPHYVLHWTRSVLDEIKSRASGTTFPEISKAAFRPIPVIVPAAELLKEFEGFAKSLYDLITANARQSRQLGQLRDYLLPRLLSGSVRVRA